ncbi:MAG: hypothetical protein IGS03_14285 [Candidatus Sericytochromatia bacterium]|nr:hypothetical protein [Candidatus Sericytochromatia bacterium]
MQNNKPKQPPAGTEPEYSPEAEATAAQKKQAAAQRLLIASNILLNTSLRRAARGVSSRIHELDQTVKFMLDNHQEVVLRVRQIDIEHQQGEVLSMRVVCRTDFENVLILAQKLRMKIAAFSVHFTVILSARPEFMAQYNDQILAMDHPRLFFETLDDIKRPIFLNLNHYITARISD